MTIAHGFGAHLAQPLLRSHVAGREDQLAGQEAIVIREMCMKVLFYRDSNVFFALQYLLHKQNLSNCKRGFIPQVIQGQPNNSTSGKYALLFAIICHYAP